MSEETDNAMTQKLIPVKRPPDPESIPQTPIASPLPDSITPITIKYRYGSSIYARQIPRQDLLKVQQLEEQCRRFCLSLFFREQDPIRSLGLISAAPGEGKTFISAITAQILAEDSLNLVTLVECNWNRPALHNLYGFSPTPGLAEWIRGECVEADISRSVAENLNVIPAGKGYHDEVRILQRLKQRGIHTTLARSNGLLIVDLPDITTSAYSSLAASLLDSVAIVARIGVTHEDLLRQTCAELSDVSIAGIILNEVESKR